MYEMSHKNFRANFIPTAMKIFMANSIWQIKIKKYSDEKISPFNANLHTTVFTNNEFC